MKITVSVVVQLLALVWSTITICNPAVNGGLEVLAWLVSLISAFGLLTTSIHASKGRGLFLLRALVVSAFVLVLVIASAILAPLVHMP